MVIILGCLYHIKDEFFNLVNDKYLMLNHEDGHSRPNYFILKEEKFYWAIPLSSKAEKYKNILLKRGKKFCKTIIITKVGTFNNAILLQNAFPVTEGYVKSVHIYSGKQLILDKSVEDEILKNFKKMLSLKKNGINLFYPNVDRIKMILEKELVH
nr:hypothetical protein [Bacilli bacterium]